MVIVSAVQLVSYVQLFVIPWPAAHQASISFTISQKSESVSCWVVTDSLWPHGLYPTRLLYPWDSPGKNTGEGGHPLLQGILPTQELSLGLPYCRQILYPLSPRVCSNSCPLIWWCHPIIPSSVAPLDSCPQSFPESGSFPMNQLFPSSGQSTRPSGSAPVPLMNIKGWFPLGLTDFMSFVSRRISRVFSTTTVQKHQSFGISLLCGPSHTFVHTIEVS